MVKQWGGTVLFMPEIIIGSPYQSYVEKLNHAAIEKLERISNCSIFKIGDNMLKAKKYFHDKMHLTNIGCDAFSSLIVNHIKNNNLL